jgi:hypothetical protein
MSVNLIAAAATDSGLRVRAELDPVVFKKLDLLQIIQFAEPVTMVLAAIPYGQNIPTRWKTRVLHGCSLNS